MADYQKKRLGMAPGAGSLGRDKESPLPSLNPPAKPASPFGVSKVAPPAPKTTGPPSAANRSLIAAASATVGADEAFEFSDEDEVESSVEEKKAPPNIDFKNFNYKTADLNKLSDTELKAHKAAMEVNFQKNNVKKGDPGFQYDKRVDFKYNAANAAADDSWDESEDKSDDGVIATSNPVAAVKSKPRGIGLVSREEEHVAAANDDYDDENDDAYFDDDFDDDFQ